MKAWHFLLDNKRCAHGYLGEISVGQTLKHEGPIKLGAEGLHASEQLLHALRYAHGSILCRIELSGHIIKGDDKCVATERKVLWMGNIETLLFNYAYDETERWLKQRNALTEDAKTIINTGRIWANTTKRPYEIPAELINQLKYNTLLTHLCNSYGYATAKRVTNELRLLNLMYNNNKITNTFREQNTELTRQVEEFMKTNGEWANDE